MSTEAEIAWAAGLFEGEGSCCAPRRADRQGVLRIAMKMRMADRDVIERFHAIVGVGAFYGPIKHIRGSDGKRLKDVFEWGSCSWFVIKDLYALFKPWLSARRQEQFEYALSAGKPKVSTHPRRRAAARACVERVEIAR